MASAEFTPANGNELKSFGKLFTDSEMKVAMFGIPIGAIGSMALGEPFNTHNTGANPIPSHTTATATAHEAPFEPYNGAVLADYSVGMLVGPVIAAGVMVAARYALHMQRFRRTIKNAVKGFEMEHEAGLYTNFR